MHHLYLTTVYKFIFSLDDNKKIHSLNFYSTAIAVFDSMNCTTRPGLITTHHRHATDTIMRLVLNKANIQNLYIKLYYFVKSILNRCPCPRGLYHFHYKHKFVNV